jgi:adhesin transport system membrane fusion protein
MSRLDELLARNPGLGWRRGALLVMALVVAALAWAAGAQFEQVAVAHGEVAPRDRVKVIQHLDGGVIKRLFVREGETVAAGAPLVELTLPAGQLNEPELRVRLDGLELKLARLRAAGRVDSTDGTPLALPAEVAGRRPGLAAAEAEAFAAERARLESSLQGLEEQILQRRYAIQELNETHTAVRAELGLARENLAISQGLFDDGLTSRMEHLERRQDVSRLEGELAALAPAIPRAEAALAEAEEKLRETRLTFRREALEEARDLESEIARTRELLASASEREARTVLRSPVDGIVKNLRYVTVGGVVRTGEPIMELVPIHDNLVIEARLSPRDRGPVHVGQAVRIKISTYDFLRYGVLEGTIAQISADTTQDPEEGPYFRLVVEPARAYLGEGPELLPIMPGMVAQVDVLTGRRSLLTSVVEPLLRIRDEAFRERI